MSAKFTFEIELKRIAYRPPITSYKIDVNACNLSTAKNIALEKFYSLLYLEFPELKDIDLAANGFYPIWRLINVESDRPCKFVINICMRRFNSSKTYFADTITCYANTYDKALSTAASLFYEHFFFNFPDLDYKTLDKNNFYYEYEILNVECDSN